MTGSGKIGLVAFGAAALVMSAASVTLAQPGPGGGGGQPGGGRMGGMRQGGMMGGRGGGGGLFLLRNKSVQEELKMTQPQIDKLAAKQQEMMEQMRAAFQRGGDQGGPGAGPGGPGGGPGGPGGDPQARAQRMEQMQAVQQKAVADILDTTQLKRFQQIELQQQGPAAVMRKEVGDKLGVTAAQKTQIQGIESAQRDQMRASMQGIDFRSMTPEDRTKMMEKLTAMRKATGDKILAALTAPQKARWATMVGKPFKMVQEPFGGGMRGGQRPPQ